MKSYVAGFFVAGSGLIIALALWVVGYIVLPNSDTHRHLAENPKIQTSATQSDASSSAPTTGAAPTGGSSPSSGATGGTSTQGQSLYTMDKATKTVQLSITAGDPSVASGMNFNGYANGQLVITVPVNWNVDIAFKNVDASMPHSVGVVNWADHLQFQAKPAFPGSEEANFNSGITASSGTVHIKFKAAKAGKYGMICGIPGHAAAGMWDEFDVSGSSKNVTVKTPSGTTTVK